MTVETTLQDMYDNFPDLFSNRQECYDHLFCTNGNGYTWRWGQIVENVYGLEDDKELHELKRLDNLEDYNVDIGEYDPNKHYWYPLCKYALILNIPDDVKPDWKKAIEECKEMMKKDGIKTELEGR